MDQPARKEVRPQGRPRRAMWGHAHQRPGEDWAFQPVRAITHPAPALSRLRHPGRRRRPPRDRSWPARGFLDALPGCDIDRAGKPDWPLAPSGAVSATTIPVPTRTAPILHDRSWPCSVLDEHLDRVESNAEVNPVGPHFDGEWLSWLRLALWVVLSVAAARRAVLNAQRRVFRPYFRRPFGSISI